MRTLSVVEGGGALELGCRNELLTMFSFGCSATRQQSHRSLYAVPMGCLKSCLFLFVLLKISRMEMGSLKIAEKCWSQFS